MKNILFALSLLIFFSTCRQFKPAVPQFILSGKIQNLDKKTFKLVHPLDDIIFEINEDGTFSDTIYDFVDGYYKLVAGKEYTDIYIEDGFNLYFDLDVIDFDESIQYKGVGANENNFLAQKILTTENVNFWGFCKSPEDVFLHKIDSFTVLKEQNLNRLIEVNSNMSKKFVKNEKAEIKYFKPFVKENYELYHNYFNKTENFEVSDTFFDYRKTVLLEDISLKEVNNYTSYVEKYLKNHIPKEDTTEAAFAMLRVINKEIHDNKLKKYFIYRSAKENMPYVEKFDEYWALVSYMVTEKREFKELNKLKRKLDKVKKGKESPSVSFKDENDKIHSLSEFKGKIVFIDCWAQWCAPCKKEIPFLKEIETKFKDKEIVFLKLSLDEDVEAWKSYIKEHSLEENAFILENAFKSDFAKDYMITGIPRFILLDKELKIIDANAKRPSNKALVSQLEELL